MMDELLSVIIPNYNKEKYLKTCLDSVLLQTYPKTEIIVVDDVSTDHSREIIEEYAEKYSNVLPVFLNENKGVSHARNVGIHRAHGKYVTMLDSDDFYYSKDKLKNEMEMLERHQGKGVAYSYRVVVDENGKEKYPGRTKLERYVSGDVFFHFLIEKNACEYVQRDYCLAKKKLLEVGAYNENESYYEDYDLLLRLAEKNKFYYSQGDGTAYRVVSNGLSSNQKKNDAAQFIVPQKIRLKYIKRLDKKRRNIASIIWIFETGKLMIRIFGRKVLYVYRRKRYI